MRKLCSHCFNSFCWLGIPHWKNTSLQYQEKEAYFTALLELGYMFDGGGVPINHYTIQVDNGTQLETPGPTYSFDIMYNTTLSVNISAHNCAGYSDPLPLEIQFFEATRETPSYWPTKLVVEPSKTMVTNALFINTKSVIDNGTSANPSDFLNIANSPTHKSTPRNNNSVGQLVLMVVPVTTVTTMLIIILGSFSLMYTLKRLAKSRHNAAGKVTDSHCTTYP